MNTLRAALRLARWLGPWTPEAQAPGRVRRRELWVPPGPGAPSFPAWLYLPPRRVTGALLVVPGLHFAGPADPRLDRFCRVLADAGLLTLAPFLPDFARMRVEPTLGRDAERAFDALLEAPERPPDRLPGVLSISFGSLPAIDLASRRHDVGGLMLYGGYADFRNAIRFSLAGAEGRAHDPLNQCVVFMNLVEHMDVDEPERLYAAWMEYVHTTWGRPHLKKREAYAPWARTLAARRLEGRDAETFLVTTGVLPGAVERMEAALAQKPTDHLDPLDRARQVHCPAIVAHGRDDDVIPFEQAPKLAAAIPGAQLWVTGLYTHTGPARSAELLRALPRELRAMAGIVTGMARTGVGARLAL